MRLDARGQARPPSGAGALIPPEWVGLPSGGPDAAPAATSGSPDAAGRGRVERALADALPRIHVLARFEAGLDAAVREHVTPVEGWLERSNCIIEPGKPCRGSGRCRQRGY